MPAATRRKPATIPPPEELELYQDRGWFEEAEVEELNKFRGLIEAIEDYEQRVLVGRRLLRSMWPDELEYIEHVCWITDKKGEKILFKANYAQRRFYEDVIQLSREKGIPIRGIILKARQLGFSTFIQLWQYVQAELNPYRNCMTISYDEGSTKTMHRTKTRFCHDNHWFPLPTATLRAEEIEFEAPHGSTFLTRTAGSEEVGRSFTIQHIHLSEMPMWQKDPNEVMLGVRQAVPMLPDTSEFIESTAKGRMGMFFETWDDAVRGLNDFIPFFAPWKWDPSYSMPFITPHAAKEFAQCMTMEDVRYQQRHQLTLEQMHWRRWVIRNKCANSERRFRQEYPIEPDEAFLTTGNPVFNPEAVRDLGFGATVPQMQGEIVLVRD